MNVGLLALERVGEITFLIGLWLALGFLPPLYGCMSELLGSSCLISQAAEMQK